MEVTESWQDYSIVKAILLTTLIISNKIAIKNPQEKSLWII